VENHVDLHVLATLREVMEGEYPALLDVFIKDSEQRVVELNGLIRDPGFCSPTVQHLKQLADKVHSFKGSCSNMGAAHLTDLCRELEESARSPAGLAGAEITQRVAAITAEFSVVRDLFEVHLHAARNGD
jgi:HPt (histidine-containing phosphotransfer) domain-containing protein